MDNIDIARINNKLVENLITIINANGEKINGKRIKLEVTRELEEIFIEVARNLIKKKSPNKTESQVLQELHDKTHSGSNAESMLEFIYEYRGITKKEHLEFYKRNEKIIKTTSALLELNYIAPEYTKELAKYIELPLSRKQKIFKNRNIQSYFEKLVKLVNDYHNLRHNQKFRGPTIESNMNNKITEIKKHIKTHTARRSMAK